MLTSRTALSRPSTRLLLALFGIALISCLLVSPSPALAATLTVTTTNDEIDSDFDCSLREALLASNTDSAVLGCGVGSGVDTILIPFGTYDLTIPGTSEDAGLTGDLDITDAVVIQSSTQSRPIIRSQVGDRAFEILYSGVGSVELHNLTISDSGAASLEGGGLRISTSNSTLTRIEDCIISNNTAAFGGGIGHDTGQLIVARTVIADNLASNLGGGVSYFGTATMNIQDSLVARNVETANFYPNFGGGGGIYASGTYLQVWRTTFLDNEAVGVGGGLMISPGRAAEIFNSTFSGNISQDRGGALFCGNVLNNTCSVTFYSNTVTKNRAVVGGGLHMGTNATDVDLLSSVIAQNVANGFAPDIFGPYQSIGFNSIGDGDDSTGTIILNSGTDMIGTSGAEIDPVLGPIAYNGYDVPVHRPLRSSPLVNTGQGSGMTASEDQRGVARPGAGLDDRGSVELIDFNVNLYLDLGIGATLTASSYGAAATTPGLWNEVGLGTTLLDEATGLYVTGVEATVTSAASLTLGVLVGPAPEQHLLADAVYDCSAPANWSISFSDLPDGEYIAYVYAPADPGTGTGTLTIGGAQPGNLVGDQTALVEFETYLAQRVSVSSGTLTLSGSDPFAVECAGVAGVQLLPEPSFASALGLGLLALGFSSRRRA